MSSASNISQLRRRASSAYLLRNLRVLGSEIDDTIARDTALEHVDCIQRCVLDVHNRQTAVYHAAALQQLLTDVTPFWACASLQELEDLCAKAHEALTREGQSAPPQFHPGPLGPVPPHLRQTPNECGSHRPILSSTLSPIYVQGVRGAIPPL